jgi:LPXTG-motif cell wall-anchored protein
MDRRSSSALIAVVAALLIAVPALAATGKDGSGGTPTKPPPEVGPSGGVAGPGTATAEDAGARAAQDPDEQPPEVAPPDETETETTPEPAPDEEETAPDETTPEDDAETAPDEGSGTAPTTGGGGGGGGLPNTGMELASMAAVGLGLVLAGWVLRRRPTEG